MTAADPTLQLLRDLDDPSKYVRQDNVPIFCAHSAWKTAYGRDGKPLRDQQGNVVKRQVQVSEQDLHTIAANMNRRAAAGDPPRLILGHTLTERNAPEQNQPRPVGFAKQVKVGPYGPQGKQAILADCRYRREDLPEIRTYPYRSPEFYAEDQDITAIAWLRRDPELDLGTITYARHAKGPCHFYAMENSMDPLADPTAPPSAAVPSAPAAPVEPSHQDKLEQFAKHAFSHQYAKCMCDHYGAAPAAPAGDAPPAPAPMAPPAPLPPPSDKPPDLMSKSRLPAQYERERSELLARLDGLEKAKQESDRNAKLAQYRSELTDLERDGVELDIDEELADCAEMTPEQFAKRVERIATHYQRAPIGGSGHRSLIAGNGYEGGAREQKFTDDDLRKCTQYMKANEDRGLSSDALWAEAEEFARGKRSITGAQSANGVTALAR